MNPPDTEPPFKRRSFDPHSTDSMFATLLARMDTQDKFLERIEAGVLKTNGRVTALERWRDVLTAKTAGIAAGASAVVSLALWLLKNWPG